MERRVSSRVSDAQWNILLDFLERHPNLARGYNNRAQGRAESSRQWAEVAELLNAEGTGTFKTSKDWSIYVSNYKSKLKKVVAGINADASATGGGPPQASSLSDIETRFLAIMGHGFGQGAPMVSVDPCPQMDLQQPATPAMPQILQINVEDVQNIVVEDPISDRPVLPNVQNVERHVETSAPVQNPAQDDATVHLPRRTRQARYRSRPLHPLDEARRVLSQVEMARAAADADQAKALTLLGQNMGRLADNVSLVAQQIGRLADLAEQYFRP